MIPINLLCKLIVNNLSDDLRLRKYRGSPNILSGHCYISSETLYHMMGGPNSGWHPMFIRWQGQPHWYLAHENGAILDITAGQFNGPIDYSAGRGKGFLTKAPSKRARELEQRVRGMYVRTCLGKTKEKSQRR